MIKMSLLKPSLCKKIENAPAGGGLLPFFGKCPAWAWT